MSPTLLRRSILDRRPLEAPLRGKRIPFPTSGISRLRLIPAPPVPADFVLSQDSAECSAGNLAPGDNCDISYAFQPRAGGLLTEGAWILDNSLDVMGARQSLTMIENGISNSKVATRTKVAVDPVTSGVWNSDTSDRTCVRRNRAGGDGNARFCCQRKPGCSRTDVRFQRSPNPAAYDTDRIECRDGNVYACHKRIGKQRRNDFHGDTGNITNLVGDFCHEHRCGAECDCHCDCSLLHDWRAYRNCPVYEWKCAVGSSCLRHERSGCPEYAAIRNGVEYYYGVLFRGSQFSALKFYFCNCYSFKYGVDHGDPPGTAEYRCGKAGQAVVILTPLNAFSDTVSLVCVGLIRGATCKFSPASLSFSTRSTISQSVTLVIDPHALTVAGLRMPPKTIPVLRLGLLLLGLGAMFPPFLSRQRTATFGWGRILLVLICVGLGSVLGCTDLAPPAAISDKITVQASTSTQGVLASAQIQANMAQ